MARCRIAPPLARCRRVVRARMETTDLHGLRGTFHSRYAMARSNEPGNNKRPRLLECLLTVVPFGDSTYFGPCAANEFAVVDMDTGEKAWLEIPPGYTPEILHRIIESHFARLARRVTESVWVV